LSFNFELSFYRSDGYYVHGLSNHHRSFNTSLHNKHYNEKGHRTVKMTTSFVVALKPFLLLSKMLGLISITYTLESGLLDKTPRVMYYSCLELIRTIVLIGFTYVFHINNTFSLRGLVLLKFWTTIITARVSEIWIIRYYNAQ